MFLYIGGLLAAAFAFVIFWYFPTQACNPNKGILITEKTLLHFPLPHFQRPHWMTQQPHVEKELLWVKLDLSEAVVREEDAIFWNRIYHNVYTPGNRSRGRQKTVAQKTSVNGPGYIN